jgi:CBS domain containing-hemolysin-like protein
VVALVVVFVIVLVGILFDMIGVAVAAAEETPFHSMAARKIHGARQSIRLIRSAPRVSSFCNDVIGDICGVVSGTAGAAIVFRMFANLSDTTWAEALMGAAIAALTVGGKAFGKSFSMRNSNYIIFVVGRVLAFFTPAPSSRKQVRKAVSRVVRRDKAPTGGSR